MRIHIAALVITAVAAQAQTVRFLVPDTHGPAPNAPLTISLEADRAPAPWPQDRCEWLFVKGSGRIANRHDVVPDQPASEAVTITASANGVTLVGLELRPVIESIPRETLMKSLPGLVADVPPLPNREVIRVRRRESLSTHLRVEPNGGHSPVATQKNGLNVEMRAMFDPTMATPGSDLPVRVYADGSGASGIRIHAECLDGGAATIVIADGAGIAYLPITHTGRWRIQAHTARPAPPGSDFDITLYSSTMTFEVTKEAVR